SAAGTYVLRLTANDGEIKTSDDITLAATVSTVTVNATTPAASEQGLVPGVFTVTRTGTAGSLPVQIALTGTATQGTDYINVGTQVIIPDGSTNAAVTITPLADTTAEGSETVILTLTANPNYLLGSPASATVTLADLPIDQWRFAQFGASANDPLIAGPNANPDGDTLINLLEYAFGTMAMSANSSPAVTDIVTIGPDRFLRLTLPKNPAATDLVYQVQATGNVALPLSWSSAGLFIELNDGTTLRVRDNVPLDSGASATRFLRGLVTPP
ncbi:MAG TPA: Calx-beta domain-containing protein, partial [Roseimicrobium sp.]|nr:Calx-beta domain-containing protein [Roseimicrobium sp.]